MPRLYLSTEEPADELLGSDPLALLTGMLLDQQVPMERAFVAPYRLAERLGMRRLDAAAIAQHDPQALSEVFATPPALHRFPGAMAARVQQLCQVVLDEYDGDASAVWAGAESGRDLIKRLGKLPGFGKQKAQIFTALLGKQLGVQPEGWREAAGPYGEDGVFRSVADITDDGQVERLVAQTIEVHGRIDVLANVAGVLDNFKTAHETDDATWRRVMAVNVDGPMLLSRAVLPHLRERGGGCIVNVGSQASVRGGTAGFAYTTSKHALLGQTRSIAWTYAADGVRCNVVCPGGVETNISAGLTDPSQLGLERAGPVLGTMPPIASADQIATLISWLASDEAGNVNGAVITSDGGWAVG